MHLNLTNIYRGTAYSLSAIYLSIEQTLNINHGVNHIATGIKKGHKKQPLPSGNLQSRKEVKYLMKIIITENLY